MLISVSGRPRLESTVSLNEAQRAYRRYLETKAAHDKAIEGLDSIPDMMQRRRVRKQWKDALDEDHENFIEAKRKLNGPTAQRLEREIKRIDAKRSKSDSSKSDTTEAKKILAAVKAARKELAEAKTTKQKAAAEKKLADLGDRKLTAKEKAEAKKLIAEDKKQSSKPAGKIKRTPQKLAAAVKASPAIATKITKINDEVKKLRKDLILAYRKKMAAKGKK